MNTMERTAFKETSGAGPDFSEVAITGARESPAIISRVM